MKFSNLSYLLPIVFFFIYNVSGLLLILLNLIFIFCYHILIIKNIFYKYNILYYFFLVIAIIILS